VFESDLLAVVDGGALRSGLDTPKAYGSYHLATRDGRKQSVGLDLGTATRQRVCDPAKYCTLIAGLNDLLGRIQKACRSPAAYSVLVHTGFRLIVGQVTQGWQVKAANPSRGSGWPFRPLIEEARSLLSALLQCDLIRVPRDEIVRALGHQARV
jgi:hypothetical protein